MVIPTTKYSRAVLHCLEGCGVVNSISRLDKGISNGQRCKVVLNYVGGKPCTTNLILLTKPSRRIYIKYKQLLQYMTTRRGILILSTSRGIITDRDATKLRVGGVALLWILI